jgi:hypothetical protein
MKEAALMKRITRRLPATIALLVGGFIAVFAATGGVAGAAAPAPENTAAPTVSGTADEGQTLTAQTGTWTATPQPSYAYSWERCDSKAAGCAVITGADTSTYKLVTADVGHVVRVNVTASNKVGSSSAASSPTDMVTGQTTGTSVDAKDVALPLRLVVDQIQFSPNPVKSKAQTITARYHVSDTKGRSVVGALVYMVGIPSNRIPRIAEGQTNSTGWAEFQFQPLAKFPIQRGGSQVIMVRARTPQGDVLAGASTRRLVQFSVTVP